MSNSEKIWGSLNTPAANVDNMSPNFSTDQFGKYVAFVSTISGTPYLQIHYGDTDVPWRPVNSEQDEIDAQWFYKSISGNIVETSAIVETGFSDTYFAASVKNNEIVYIVFGKIDSTSVANTLDWGLVSKTNSSLGRPPYIQLPGGDAGKYLSANHEMDLIVCAVHETSGTTYTINAFAREGINWTIVDFSTSLTTTPYIPPVVSKNGITIIFVSEDLKTVYCYVKSNANKWITPNNGDKVMSVGPSDKIKSISLDYFGTTAVISYEKSSSGGTVISTYNLIESATMLKWTKFSPSDLTGDKDFGTFISLGHAGKTLALTDLNKKAINIYDIGTDNNWSQKELPAGEIEYNLGKIIDNAGKEYDFSGGSGMINIVDSNTKIIAISPADNIIDARILEDNANDTSGPSEPFEVIDPPSGETATITVAIIVAVITAIFIFILIGFGIFVGNKKDSYDKAVLSSAQIPSAAHTSSIMRQQFLTGGGGFGGGGGGGGGVGVGVPSFPMSAGFGA